MATTTKDVTQGGLRPVGWFSRRNQKADAQFWARHEYFKKHPNKKPHKRK